jgi:hypothetical protein
MRRRQHQAAIFLAATLVLAIGLAGCASLGPRTLDRDQIHYGNSIGDNWKNQMLANLVKMRFVDMPVFVDVGQIVAGYSLETQVNGAVGFGTALSGGDSQSVGAGGRYTDRPTITYMPKTGENYLRSLLEPVEPESLLALIAAGYNPELLFTWAVESINGVRNFSATGGARLPDPQYYEFVDLLVTLQQSGMVGFEVKEDPETGRSVVLFFNGRNMTEDALSKRARVRELLDLDPDQNEYTVTFSPFALEGNVLALQTRSVLQVLNAMSGFVDIPANKAARATSGYSLPPGFNQPFAVRTSTERPEDPFAIFNYHGDWYWIDHEDLASKRVFTLMLFLTTLTNRATAENAPVLTIPTN